ncbi:MAG: hypothetical protein ABIQ99_06265 [Thermoflexales bacterium]
MPGHVFIVQSGLSLRDGGVAGRRGWDNCGLRSAPARILALRAGRWHRFRRSATPDRFRGCPVAGPLRSDLGLNRPPSHKAADCAIAGGALEGQDVGRIRVPVG